MNLRQIIERFRRDVKDTAEPYLVDPDDAVRYLNQAISEISRRTRCLVDSTNFVASVVSGDPIVSIDQRIISIRRARLASSSAPLTKMTVREMDEMYPGWDRSSTPSTPMFVIVDYQTDALYLYPTPRINDELAITATREPLEEVNNNSDIPEIPGRWHEGAINWMRYRAYDNDDSDLYDPAKAAKALALFETEFGPISSAVNERWDFEHYDDVGER